MSEFLKRRIDQALDLVRDLTDLESPNFIGARAPLRRMLSAEIFGDVEPGLITGIRERLAGDAWDDDARRTFERIVQQAGSYAFVGDEVLVALALPMAVRVASPEEEGPAIHAAHRTALGQFSHLLAHQLRAKAVFFDGRLYSGADPSPIDRMRLRDDLAQLRRGRLPSAGFRPLAPLRPRRHPQWQMVHLLGVVAFDARTPIDPEGTPAREAFNEFGSLTAVLLTALADPGCPEGWTFQVDADGIQLMDVALASGLAHLRGLRLAEFLAPGAGEGHDVTYLHCHDPAHRCARVLAWEAPELREFACPVRDAADYRAFAQQLSAKTDQFPPEEGGLLGVSLAVFEQQRANLLRLKATPNLAAPSAMATQGEA